MSLKRKKLQPRILCLGVYLSMLFIVVTAKSALATEVDGENLFDQEQRRLSPLEASPMPEKEFKI